jgi:hypothetical protein
MITGMNTLLTVKAITTMIKIVCHTAHHSRKNHESLMVSG